MKVLLISGSFPPMKCGVGDYTFHLAKELVKQKDVKVTVLTDKLVSQCDLNCNVDVISTIKNWSYKDIFKIIKIVRNKNPDIVHIQYPSRGYGKKLMPSWLPFLLRVLNIPVVQTWHEPLSWKGWFRYLPNALTKDTLVVVESNYKDMLPVWYKWIIKQKKMVCIPIASNIPKVTLKKNERLEIRSKFDATSNNLFAYFGFVSPSKGIDVLFKIANPSSDRIVLICELNKEDWYHKRILEIVNSEPWAGKVYVTGFLPDYKVAKILAVSDAAIFPFAKGVSMRNGSFLAARAQEIFVLTTHQTRVGYNASEHVYYARLGNIGDLQQNLYLYLGKKNNNCEYSFFNWSYVAKNHFDLYCSILNELKSS